MNTAVRNLSTSFAVAVTFTLIWQFAHAEAPAQKPQPSSLSDQLKSGGLLYDNWLVVTQTKLSKTNPGYPPSSKKTGKNTWRCKECHGWDYIGARGRYKKGSHYTGINGLFDSRHKKRA